MRKIIELAVGLDLLAGVGREVAGESTDPAGQCFGDLREGRDVLPEHRIGLLGEAGEPNG